MTLTLISSQTASSSTTIDFTSNIDSTYDSYEFYYLNIHPSNDNVQFMFQVETGTDSDYDHPMVTTFVESYNSESGTNGAGYSTADDQATTGDGNGVFSILAKEVGNLSDETTSGILTLYDPSDTTFVKNFTNSSQTATYNSYAKQVLTAGYINTTSAITRVRFKMSAGTIDTGGIYMYGNSGA